MKKHTLIKVAISINDAFDTSAGATIKNVLKQTAGGIYGGAGLGALIGAFKKPKRRLLGLLPGSKKKNILRLAKKGGIWGSAFGLGLGGLTEVLRHKAVNMGTNTVPTDLLKEFKNFKP